MKKLIYLAVIAVSLSLSGCAVVATPALGTIYTDVKAPIMATSNSLGSKVGTGEVTSILGAVATGDASIQSAAQSAGITRISHVDYESTNILGIFATYTVYVYGE